MPRIMALDVGDRTIGVAVTDELGITAMPLRIIERGTGMRADIQVIEQLIHELEVSTVVVGIPIMLNGTSGIQAEKVRRFAGRLARRIKVPVVLWDERLTTVEAEKALLEADTSRAKRKRAIDKLAAALILQSYLEAHRDSR